MIVLDDYIEGVIYAATDLNELHLNLVHESLYQEYPYKEAINMMAESNIKEIHVKSDNFDFYILEMDDSKLMNYMIERNAANFIKGV